MVPSSPGGSLSPASRAVVLLLVTGTVALPPIRWILRRRNRGMVASDLRLVTWPARLLVAAVLGRVLLRNVAPESWERTARWLSPVLVLVAIAAAAWTLIRALDVGKRIMFRRLRIDVADNLRARSRRTQIQLVKRVADVFVWATAAVVGLLTLEPVREMGPALVAYAGIIGVVLGLALRAPLENLMAGLIVAATEPVRIDDVVVVEGEWGNVEELGLSHVALRLWDDRRFVVPTSYFLNQPFENWTRHGAALLGRVMLRVDRQADVAELRRSLEDVVAASPHWDGRACRLQVTDVGETSIELRAVVSARNAGEAWNLQCEIRERLLPHLSSRDAAPRLRAEVLANGTDGRRSEHRHDRIHLAGGG